MRILGRTLAGLGLLVVGTFAAVVPASAQSLFKPIAVVNDSAITGFDLAQRAQVLVVLGFSAASPDALRATALDQLVEDRLKLQAGKAIGIEPNAELIKAALETVAKSRNLSVPEFQALMNNKGVTNMALEDLAGAEAVWRQVIRARFSQRVQPGEAEIDSEIALLKRGGAFEYRFQEIGLPLTADGRNEQQTRALAEQLYNQLRGGGNFKAAVRKYSKSPSAARGGDVGWVSIARMPAELQNSVRDMNVGAVSPPLAVPGGISILKMTDRRARNVGDLDDPKLRERIRTQLVLRKSARLAEGLLQELRRDALIDVR